MKTRNLIFTAIGVFTVMPYFSSCSKDTDYDNLLESDAIDLTVQLGQGLTLPFGSTDKIMITELMNPEKVEQLQVGGNGQFSLSQTGSFDPTSFNVQAPVIEINPEVKSLGFSFEAPELPQAVKDHLMELLAAGIDVTPYLGHPINELLPQGTDVDFPTDIQCENMDFAEVKGDLTLATSNVDKALLSASQIVPQAPVTVRVAFELNNLPGKNESYDVMIDNMQLGLPDYLVVTGEPNPTKIVRNLKATKAAGQTSAVLSTELVVERFDFAKSQKGVLRNENGVISRPDEVTFCGSAKTSKMALSCEDFTLESINGEYTAVLAQEVVVKPSINVDKITLAQVTGRFNPSINPVLSNVDINLGDDMSFFEDNDAVIDLKNPAFTLDLNNNSPIGILADITMCTDKGQEVCFGNVDCYDVDGDGKVKVILDASKVTSGDIHTLLSPMPKRVEVSVNPYADVTSDYTYVFGEQVNVGGNYEVDIPLEFRKFSFSYEKVSENIWGDDRESVTDKLKSLTGLELKLEIENAIPVQMTLGVSATNYQTGQEDASLVTCTTSQIAAGTTANPAVSSITMNVSLNDVAKVGDLILRFEGEGSDCELNANQYVRIASSVIKLNDGVSVNLK